MSEFTEENATFTTEELIRDAVTTTPEEKNNPFIWVWEGKTYPMFLANCTGGIGLPIMHPVERDKKIGQINAEFAWENSNPFLNHLDNETIDKAGKDDDWTERENESLIIKNSGLFRELVQRGESIDFDELGDISRQTRKLRADMLNYRKIVQSDLVSAWLNEFHIERWFPKEMTSIDAFLSQEIEEVNFVCKIGSKSKPRHILFFTFNCPSDDQISSYASETFTRGTNDKGDWRYSRDNDRRLTFARKHFRSVEGAMLGPLGEVEFNDSSACRLADPNNKEDMSAFKKGFNPNWFVRLAEEVAGAFNLAKK